MTTWTKLTNKIYFSPYQKKIASTKTQKKVNKQNQSTCGGPDSTRVYFN